MKKLFLIGLLFIGFLATATSAIPTTSIDMMIQAEPAPEIPIFAFILEFLLTIVTVLVTLAVKHFFAGQWNWTSFWEGNLKPMIWSVGGALVIVAVHYFLPDYMFLIEQGIGQEVSLDHESLIITGTALALAFKVYFDAKRIKA